MTYHVHPSSQFEQFTIDQGAQITITRIDVFQIDATEVIPRKSRPT